MTDEHTSEVQIIAVEGGAPTLPALPKPDIHAHRGVVSATLPIDGEPTRPVAPPPGYRRGYLSRVYRRWRGIPLADWLRPPSRPLETWVGGVPSHTVARWLRKARVRAFLVGVAAGAVGFWVGLVLVGSLVAAVMADALLFAAYLVADGA